MAREPKRTSEPIKKKPQFAWALLHESKSTLPSPPRLPAGRPPRSAPTRKSTVHLTSGDEEAIHVWQKVFSEMLDRKISLGETFGLLARLCQERADSIGISLTTYNGPASFIDLVQKMVGVEED